MMRPYKRPAGRISPTEESVEQEKDVYPKILLAGTDPDLPDVPPEGFAKYIHFHEMARGIKAVLYSCWDTMMGRSVAMKTLLPDFAQDKRERRRFLREARVTAQLQHPNTVPVYEIGRDDQSRLYFTMKRIAGENFFQVIKKLSKGNAKTVATYPLREQLHVVIQACQALAYAHAHGVIHRDVKPENIWIGRFGEVILLDWGVAKVWGMPDETGHMETEEPVKSGDEATRWEVNPLATSPDEALGTLTQTGQRPGTPLYMAPEQVNRYIDERCDVFSMGVLLSEMLTFHEPFRGRNVRETFDKILYSNPTPPSQAAPDRVIPESLDVVVAKAIAKRASDRYQSMPLLIDALNKCLADMLRVEGA